MEEEFYLIQIPGNIKLRMEIINGVGIKELIQTGIAGIISAIIAIIIHGITNNYLLSIGIFLAVTAITFIAVMKDKNNSSIARYYWKYY